VQFTATNRTWQTEPLALAVAALAAGLVASVFYTPLVVVAVLVVPAAVYFVTRPYELLLLMVFFIPFNFVFKVGPLPVAFEVVKLLAWVPFFATRKERPAFIKSRYTPAFAIIAGVIGLSLARAHDLPFTLKECVRVVSNIGLVYLCINLVRTREQVMQVFRVLTVSTFVVALYGFYQWMIQDYGALFWIVNPRLDTSLAHYRDYFWEWRHRIISVLTSEMELGHYFNMCLPVGALLWITEGRRSIESKWLWITLAMFAGLILTFTFGAWLALGCTCVLAILKFGGERKWRVLFWGTAAFVVVATFLALGPLYNVIEAKASGTGIGSLAWDAATRLYGWKLALQIWWAHPLWGGGIGNYEFVSADYDFVLGPNSQGSSPHETYLYLLANYGLIGAISVLYVLWKSLRANLNLLTGAEPEIRLVAGALAFAICCNLVGWFADDSGFLGPHAGYLLWLLVGLSEVLWRGYKGPSTENAMSGVH
jgi:putative inorganic carbon (hco3(-)) transporter